MTWALSPSAGGKKNARTARGAAGSTMLASSAALVLAVFPAAALGSPACNASLPYCNPTFATEARIKNGRLLSRATTLEKASMLFGGSIDRLGVPKLEMGEALHGVVNGCEKDSAGREFCPSSFPCALNLGATLNESLWKKIGATIGTESRAVQPGGGARFTPDINLFRDPRWGRGQEVPGEDPHITSRYAVQFVQGLQEDAADPRIMKVIATCKHYFAYDVDAGNASYGTHLEDTYDRHSFNAIVTKQDLVDYYLPAWEACATEAKAGSIMCRCVGFPLDLGAISACLGPSWAYFSLTLIHFGLFWVYFDLICVLL